MVARMANEGEYLLGYGVFGDFGRFQPSSPCRFERGERLVIRSRRGVEIGVVLRTCDSGHMKLLADQPVGKILRRATPDDERTAELTRRRGQQIFEDCRTFIPELDLPLEVLDAEVLLDNRQ